MKNLAFYANWSNTRSIEELTKNIVSLMGTYNNPGTSRYLFSFSLSRTNFTSPFFRIAVATRWTGNRGLIFNIRAKESNFRPVVERVEGNSRVGFNGKRRRRGEKNLRSTIFRSFNDRKRSLRSFVTPPMNIQRWLEGLNFPNERKVCPEDSYGKSCFDNVFAGIHASYVISSTARNGTRSIMER